MSSFLFHIQNFEQFYLSGLIWQMRVTKAIPSSVRLSNSPLGVLLLFYNRTKYLLGSCYFILVMDIKVQKKNKIGCPNHKAQ